MKGLSPSLLYYSSVLPSLLHSRSTGSPKGGDLPSPMWLSKVENAHTPESMWCFHPPLGKMHLLFDLYFVLCTDPTKMASQSICQQMLHHPGGHLCRGIEEGKGTFVLLGDGLASLWQQQVLQSVSYSDH